MAALLLLALPPTSILTAGPTLQVCIALDGSGSIQAEDFATMREGLAAAVADSSVIPQNGTVELTVVQFGATIHRVEVIVETTVIDSAAAASAVASAIRAAVQMSGATPTHLAIDKCREKITGSANFAGALKQNINISTDGDPSDQALTVTARDNAVAAGIDEVDLEAIGPAPSIDQMKEIAWPQPGYVAPPFTGGGFVIRVNTFADYASAIRQKLQEIIPRPTATPTYTPTPTATATATPATTPTPTATSTPTPGATPTTPTPTATPSAPQIIHILVGRSACSTCHAVGGGGVGAPGGTGLPAGHQGRADSTCTTCHRATAEATPRNVIVTRTGDTMRDVVEVDRSKNIVRQLTGLNVPRDARPLLGGNWVIADAGDSRVIEVNPDTGAIIWGVSGITSVARLLGYLGLPLQLPGLGELEEAHLAKVRSIRTPALVIHGEQDFLVPLKEGKELFAALGFPDKRLVTIPRAGHNDIMLVGLEEYFSAIRDFVGRVCPGGSTGPR